METSTVKVWFDPEADFLEVMFDVRPGHFRETANPHVMERLDESGHVIGFAIERVSAIQGAPIAIEVPLPRQAA